MRMVERQTARASGLLSTLNHQQLTKLESRAGIAPAFAALQAAA
jgi:hypothetical protein